jgi:hypothetical protein
MPNNVSSVASCDTGFDLGILGTFILLADQAPNPGLWTVPQVLSLPRSELDGLGEMEASKP